MSTQDEEMLQALTQELAAAKERIGKLEASNTALARMNGHLTERLALAEAGQDGKVKRKRGL